MRPLRILSHIAHAGHQYELRKLPHEFFYVYGFDHPIHRSFFFNMRPANGKLSFIHKDEVNPKEYDLAIVHFDNNSVISYSVDAAYAQVAAYFLQIASDIPVIGICQDTPFFLEKYDITCTRVTNFTLDDVANQQVRDRLAPLQLIVCNSYDAEREWQFHKSKTIHHGLSPDEFSFGDVFYPTFITLNESKLRGHPLMNGYYAYCYLCDHLCFPLQPLIPQVDVFKDVRVPPIGDPVFIDKFFTFQELAYKQFAQYRAYLQKIGVYVNTTICSAFPRLRTECMFSGAVTVSLNNYDVESIITHGVDGFYTNDLDEMVDILNYLYNNPEIVQQMRLKSRETAVKKLSLDRYLAEWEQTLKEIV